MTGESLPAGRELDALVAEHVMGATARDETDRRDGDYKTPSGQYLGFYDWKHYSTDIAAAWQIPNIRRVLAPGRYTTHGHDPTLWHAYCGAPDGYGEDIWQDAYAETAPHAICLAALKAVRNIREDHIP